MREWRERKQCAQCTYFYITSAHPQLPSLDQVGFVLIADLTDVLPSMHCAHSLNKMSGLAFMNDQVAVWRYSSRSQGLVGPPPSHDRLHQSSSNTIFRSITYANGNIVISSTIQILYFNTFMFWSGTAWGHNR